MGVEGAAAPEVCSMRRLATHVAHGALVGLLVVPGLTAGEDTGVSREGVSREGEVDRILQEFREARKAFLRRFFDAPAEQREALFRQQVEPETYARRLMGVVDASPADDVAWRALEWVVTSCHDCEASRRALDRLAEHHLDRPGLPSLLRRLPHGCCPRIEPLLRRAAQDSAREETRGVAAYSLAIHLHHRSQLARSLEEHCTRPSTDLPTDRRRLLREWIASGDPAELDREAERWLRLVRERYGQIRTPAGSLGDLARARLHEILHLEPGRAAPEIRGTDLEGRDLRLSGQRGRVVVLLFWSHELACCRAAYPCARQLVKEFQGLPVVLLGVCGDPGREAARARQVAGQTPWRAWFDGGSRSGPIAREWSVRSWPSNWVIDARGTIRHRNLQGKSLRDAVRALLEEPDEKEPATPSSGS